MVSSINIALFLGDVGYIEYAATKAEELAHGIVAIDMDEGVYFPAFLCLDIRFDVPGLRLVSRMPSYGGGQRKMFLSVLVGEGVVFPRFVPPERQGLGVPCLQDKGITLWIHDSLLSNSASGMQNVTSKFCPFIPQS
jgi:hypothetical protein